MYNTESELIFALEQFIVKINEFKAWVVRLDATKAAEAVTIAPPEKLDSAIADLKTALAVAEKMRSDWGLQKFNDRTVSGRLVILETKIFEVPPLLIRSRHHLNGDLVELIGWNIEGDRLSLTFRSLN
jgi:hypothetical protein